MTIDQVLALFVMNICNFIYKF